MKINKILRLVLRGSSVHGILQARILEWVAIPFSRGSSNPGIKPGLPALKEDSLPSGPPRKPQDKYSYQCKSEVKSLSRVRFFATPWTVAYKAPLSMGFSRQEYWSGLPFPSPGDPDPGVEPGSLAL